MITPSLIAILIFVVTFVLIIAGWLDATIIALAGAILMVLFKVISFEDALASIQFETLALLMAMMIIVEVCREAGLFSWLAVKITRISKGNPLVLFVLLTFTTAAVSSILDNVTTIVLMVPMTIQLIKGMGRDPRPYVYSEIIFSNLGGALTIIGDSSNIIIGGASKLSFNDFLFNLGPPVITSFVLMTILLIVTHWRKHLKSNTKDLKQLFVSQLMLKKVDYEHTKAGIDNVFLAKAGIALLFTVAGFMLHHMFHLSMASVALAGALFLLLISYKQIQFHHTLQAVEWSTLLFFAGLFVLVGSLESAGVLNQIADLITSIADGSYLKLLIVIIWGTGIISMILNTVPFVTLMVPIIINLQAGLPEGVDPNLLWWALSLGACLGGNATIFGASANVVGVGVARKEGLHISFFSFLKYGLPLTLVALTVSSIYMYIRVS